MIDETTYEQLDRYFHSAMNEQERGAFELKMSVDKTLREEFDWLNNMLGGMKSQGRSVMKQTIASAISGAEVVKYKPSINGKSFLKKWWWAITIALVVAAAAVLYTNARAGKEGEYDLFGHGDLPSEEHSETKAFATDSCFEEALPPVGSDIDSLSQSMSAERSEEVMVTYNNAEMPKIKERPGVYYDVDDTGKLKQVRIDSAREITGGYIATWGANGTKDREQPMHVNLNLRNSPPYTYSLDKTLTLNSVYTSTGGFSFSGSGDTIYMTDNSQQRFMLLKGKGELPLVPMRVGANK